MNNIALVTWIVCSGLALILAGIAVYMGRLAFYVKRANDEFAAKGVVTQAKIADKKTRTRRRRYGHSLGYTEEYFLTYNYEYQGKEYTGTQPITKKVYDSRLQGDVVDVLILPDTPDRSRLVGNIYISGFFFSLIIGTVVLGLAAIALIVIAIVYTR